MEILDYHSGDKMAFPPRYSWLGTRRVAGSVTVHYRANLAFKSLWPRTATACSILAFTCAVAMGQNSAQSEAVKLKKDFVSKVFHYGPGCQDEHSYYLGPYTLNGLTCQLVGGPDHGCRGVVEFADVKFNFDPDPGDPLTPADKRNGIEWKGWLKMDYSSRMRPFFRGDWQSWLKWQDKRYPEEYKIEYLEKANGGWRAQLGDDFIAKVELHGIVTPLTVEEFAKPPFKSCAEVFSGR